MQRLSVLLSVLVSLVILASASPMPEAISERSSKRGELNMNFERDLLEEFKKRGGLKTHYRGELNVNSERDLLEESKKRGGLKTHYVKYEIPDEKRKELRDGLHYGDLDDLN
ncbi:hypothetical protein BDR07DRAFT_1374018 [Suillus spraguei]|nr:hypothetical protein BDR07DRAFT_1374018 [Suillus spraguei]